MITPEPRPWDWWPRSCGVEGNSLKKRRISGLLLNRSPKGVPAKGEFAKSFSDGELPLLFATLGVLVIITTEGSTCRAASRKAFDILSPRLFPGVNWVAVAIATAG